MSSISLDDVKKLAILSALNVDDGEAQALLADFQAILGYIDQLDEVEVAGVEPTYYVHGLENVSRPDEVINYGVSQSQLFKNAPAQRDNQIEVPKVLDV